MIAFIKKHWIAATVALAVIAAIAAFIAVNAGKQADLAGKYQTTVIEKGNLVATVGATGSVHSNQTAMLGWETTGTVAAVNVEVGDLVEQGDELASLEKSSLPQSVILAEADLVAARQSLEDLLESGTAEAEAYIALDAAEEAYEDAVEYRQDLDEKTEFEIVKFKYNPILGSKVPQLKTLKGYADEDTKADADADAALKKAQYEDALRTYNRLVEGVDIAAAEARVAAAEATLNTARITAPFAATVTEVEPVPGDQVGAGAPAFRLDDLSRLLVDVDLSEVDINIVSPGQDVLLAFDAILDTYYHGVVVDVGQVGKDIQGVVNFTVTVELVDIDERVKPGMTAAVTITVNELKDVTLVPNRAVRVLDGRQVVVVIDPETGMTEIVEVRLGASADMNSVVVGGDLELGDTVILNPPAALLGQNPFSGPPGS